VLQIDDTHDSGDTGSYSVHETLGLVSNIIGDLTSYSY